VYSAAIETATCDRAPGCPVARVCPRHAVVPVPGGAYPGANGWRVDEELCTGCGVCVRACPTRSVSLRPRVTSGR
jgi:MinD superfamily P-loop ATPase